MNKQKLGKHIYQIRGISFKPKDVSSIFLDDYVPIIKSNNITEEGFYNTGLIYINRKHVRSEQFILKGDLVLTASSGSRKTIGKNIQFDADYDGSFGAFCKLVRPKETIHAKYLYHFFRTRCFRETIEKAVQGANIANLKNEYIDDLQIFLPSVNDQIRIAEVLTRAEKLIAKRKESIKALDELLKSTFLEMFGPMNVDFKSWPLTEIKDLAASHKGAMRTGPFGSNLLHSEFTETGDVAVLGIDNAVQNKFAWGERRFITKAKYSGMKNYQIFPGDVIITIMGTIGRTAVIPDDVPLAINTKHLAAITFDKQKADPKFIAYSFHSSPYIKNQLISKNRGAIMNGLNLGLIKEVKLRKPPITLQNQFAAIVEKVESIKAKYSQNLSALENLYGSLSQQAFKGELDLSKVPLPDHEPEY